MSMKASYTVEAAFVVSFCLIILGMAILLGFEMFQGVLEYVQGQPDVFDAVKLYRLKEGASGTMHAIFD